MFNDQETYFIKALYNANTRSKNATQFYNWIVLNYLFLANGGNRYMRIMEFYPKINKLQIKTYSSYLDDYKTDSQNQFVVDLSKGWYQRELQSKSHYKTQPE